MTEILVPENFVRLITAMDPRGSDWLNALPQLLANCAQRWSLTVLSPFPNLSYHYVAPAIYANGREAVIKTGIPGSELAREANALRVFDGKNSVRLLDADLDQGVIVLERLTPGVPLTSLANDLYDAQATSIAASVMRGLWQPVPSEHNFPSVDDWGKGFSRLRTHFDGGVGPFPPMLVAKAETLFAELLSSSATPVLLHGDLHHDNILSTERLPWVAIDPKGLIGEPAYEVGALLRNLWPDRHVLQNPKQILARRIAQLSEELEMDRARVQGWALAQAVLSAWWCIDDHVDCWKPAIALAELIDEITE